MNQAISDIHAQIGTVSAYRKTRKSLIFSIALIVTSLMHSTALAEDLGATVLIEGGAILGVPRNEDGLSVYKGIPYVAPPVGANRWKSPQPIKPWNGALNTTEFGDSCWQSVDYWLINIMPGPNESEDCLTLNIWTPAKNKNDKLPVMVWVHGGGFLAGTADEAISDGASLAKLGVIVVSFNYRLGVFGFLAHPDLDKEGPSGNYGLQDQLAALKWIKSNIEEFGGDPNNVTVFGESAGSHAIGLLMASPLSSGLMDKAIGQSGAFWDSEHGSLATFEESRTRGRTFMKKVQAKNLTKLRSIPAKKLIKASRWKLSLDPGTSAFGPNIDGYVIPRAPGTTFMLGKQAKIPLLAGWNTREDSHFQPRALPHKSLKEFHDSAQQVFGVSRVKEFLNVYKVEKSDELNNSANNLIGDLVISQQTWQWLDLHTKTSEAPVYGYRYTYTSPFQPTAQHTADIPFVFGNLDRVKSLPLFPKKEASQEDITFSKTVMSYWVNFAKYGDPNGEGLPYWNKFEREFIHNLGNQVGRVYNPQLSRFEFIESFREEGVLPNDWHDIPSSPKPKFLWLLRME